MPGTPVIDLATLRELARQQHDRFEIMRYMLEAMDGVDDATLDAFVEKVAAPIIESIDCTQCANCCRALSVYLTPDDVERLAHGLGQDTVEMEALHVEHTDAETHGEWGRLRARPCAFLKGTLCSVYAHRPASCRLYPQFTPDFRWVQADLIAGAALCPIIYNVLAELASRIDRGELRE